MAGSHRQLGICQQEDAFAVEHVIHLVHASVRMQSVRLSGLEPVQPYEQTRRLINGALANLVRTPLGMLCRLDDGRILHKLVFRSSRANPRPQSQAAPRTPLESP